jgi:hypothetical protein
MDYSYLIGQKVNLNEYKGEYNGQKINYYELDDPEFETRMKVTHPGHIRYWTPRTMGTRDLRMDRLNIHIDEEGIITGVYLG